MCRQCDISTHTLCQLCIVLRFCRSFKVRSFQTRLYLSDVRQQPYFICLKSCGWKSPHDRSLHQVLNDSGCKSTVCSTRHPDKEEMPWQLPATEVVTSTYNVDQRLTKKLLPRISTEEAFFICKFPFFLYHYNKSEGIFCQKAATTWHSDPTPPKQMSAPAEKCLCM